MITDFGGGHLFLDNNGLEIVFGYAENNKHRLTIWNTNMLDNSTCIEIDFHEWDNYLKHYVFKGECYTTHWYFYLHQITRLSISM